MLLKCELMLLKCELMLLKCQINTNTPGFFASYKMFRKSIEILILSFNYFELSISQNNVCRLFVFILDFNSISSRFNSRNSISSHFNSISSHFDSILLTQ